MAEKPASERTEQPTQRKLEKARKEGQVAQSQELPAVVSVIALTAVLTLTSPMLLKWLTVIMKQGLFGDPAVFASNESFMRYFGSELTSAIVAILPLMAVLLIGPALTCIAISGLNFSPKAVKLNFGALDPVKGFRRLFDQKALVKLLVSIAKIIVVSLVVLNYLDTKIPDLAGLRWSWSDDILATLCHLMQAMMIRICFVLLVIALMETFFQKWKHRQELKMTKQEIKQERKDTEGSAELKGRIRFIQMEMSRNRMLQEVPKADVVIVNPTHYAVVLKYDPKISEAPVMVAKGADHLADKIREIARAYGVPIVRKPQLARTIFSTVKPGHPIPSALYTAVAEVLAMIYRLRHHRG